MTQYIFLISRTPETISSIPSLTQLCLSDVAIPRLPLDIGNLKNLMILEARENALKTVPA
jgi:protein scribble